MLQNSCLPVKCCLQHTFELLMQVSYAAVQIGSKNEGDTLPPSILPQLRSVTMNVSNGREEGMWSAKNLALLGLAGWALPLHHNAVSRCSALIT